MTMVSKRPESTQYLHAYDALAEIYDAEVYQRPFNRNLDQKIRYLLEQHVLPVDRDSRTKAIDFGVGTATYSKVLLDKGYHVVGVDISPRMLEAAELKLGTYDGQFTPLISDIVNVQSPGTRGVNAYKGLSQSEGRGKATNQTTLGRKKELISYRLPTAGFRVILCPIMRIS